MPLQYTTFRLFINHFYSFESYFFFKKFKILFKIFFANPDFQALTNNPSLLF